MRVLYTAAHGGFASESVPLGGGAAVAEQLARYWASARPFELELLQPSLLGAQAPSGKQLVRSGERAYARFCRAFERAATEKILAHNPAGTTVLSNDVSEGPDFKRLAAAGFPIYTIYHVDVVDYVSKFYLHSLVGPEWMSRAYAWLERSPWRRWLPDIVALMVQKQQDSVTYSRGLIVPSEAMKEILLRCYPRTPPEKIHVIPWGVWEPDASDSINLDLEAARWTSRYGLSPRAPTLLTLSRISPEKGQDRLLRALALWEKEADFPDGLTLLIAGEPAFMQGRRFERRLRRLAGRLKRTRVLFTGYAAAVAKRVLFRVSDLYVFPSRHESYGLTLMEAMRAGLPVAATHSYGAVETFQPGTGDILPALDEEEVPQRLMESLRHLLKDREALKAMGAAARRYAESRRFSDSADRVAALITR